MKKIDLLQKKKKNRNTSQRKKKIMKDKFTKYMYKMR